MADSIIYEHPAGRAGEPVFHALAFGRVVRRTAY